MKSRARNPRDTTFGGYPVVDIETDGLILGWDALGRGFGTDLDGVEDWWN
jgi:hypothetical protein